MDWGRSVAHASHAYTCWSCRAYNNTVVRIRLLTVLLMLVVCAAAVSAQSVSVDEFTGTLHCAAPVASVPGPGGSGYAISMQYSSDLTPEDEASVVGFGWSLGIPSIQRIRRGYPDDHNGVPYTFVAEQPAAKITWSVTPITGLELFAVDSTPVSGNLTVSHNSTTGWTFRGGLSAEKKYGVSRFNPGITTDGDISLRLGLDTQGEKETPDGMLRAKTGVGISLSNFWRSKAPFGGDYVPLQGKMWSIQGAVVSGTQASGDQYGANIYHSTIRSMSQTLPVYGYMYSAGRGHVGDGSQVLDYSVERKRPFDDANSRNLGLPLPDFDVFSVQVSGIGGAFRLHHRLPLQVRPPDHVSTIEHNTLHGEYITSGAVGAALPIPLPGTLEIGYEFDGGGSRERMLGDGGRNPTRASMWRYIGDMAGDVRYSSTTDPILPDIEDGMGGNAYHPINRDAWPQTTRHVIHRTYGSLMAERAAGSPRAAWLAARMTEGDVAIHDSTIAEFEIVGEDGRTYLFTDVVYTLGEGTHSRTMDVELARVRTDLNTRRLVYLDHDDLKHDGHTLDPNNAEQFRSMTGVTTGYAYASQFLLSAILEPDYVDVTGDGPTDDDRGGYTVFDYTKIGVFRNRSPYRGLWYNPGSLALLDDNVISYSEWTAQVTVLKEIRTRSHRAAFVYGGYGSTEGMARSDNKEAPHGGEAWNKTDGSVAEPQRRPYLSKVMEYRRGIGAVDDVLLSTRHFVYDFSLVPDCPSCDPGTGRLTLKRTWTEQREVAQARIYPTEFQYAYPQVSTTPSPTTIDPTGLTTWQQEAIPTNALSLNENPIFNMERIDGWGQYRSAQNIAVDATYNYTPDQELGSIDPAAYRLKAIVHPTGARSVIGYEPREYKYVQNRLATMLVPLHASSSESISGVWNNKYVLDPSSIVSLTSAERQTIIDSLERRYKQDKKRLYHRLAYEFTLETSWNVKGLVRGYSHVGRVEATPDASTIDIDLSDGGTPVTWAGVTLGNFFADHDDEPRSLAYEFLNEGLLKRKPAVIPEDPISVASALFDGLLRPVFFLVDALAENLGARVELKPALSKVRIPWPRPKRGGGVRVTTVVDVSPAGILEAGDAAMVGQRYHYGDGVATSEPGSMHEQNALTDLLASDIPNDDGRTCGETDIAQAEGPFAATLMPGPGIGYRSVDVVSINPNASRPGYVTRRYHTAFDVPPVVVRKTELRTDIDMPLWFLGLNEFEYWSATATQGYAIDVVDMHGRPRSVEHRVGDPNGLSAISSGTYYRYADHREPVLLLDTLDRPMRMEHRGRQQDIIHEVKHYGEYFNVGDVMVNIQIGVPPMVGISPTYRHSTKELLTMVNAKVTSYQPVLESITSVSDGLRDSSVVVAYDRLTGAPAVVATYDEFHKVGDNHNGTVLDVSLPACRFYPELRSRSDAEGLYLSESPAGNQLYGGMTLGVTSLGGGSFRIGIAINDDNFSATDEEHRAEHLRDRFTIGDGLALYDGTAYVGHFGIQAITMVGSTVYLDGSTTLGSVPGDVDAVRVLRSNRQQQLRLPGISMRLYDVDLNTLRADARKLYERSRRADLLNDYVRGNGQYNTLVNQHELALAPPVSTDPMPASVADDVFLCFPDTDQRYGWLVRQQSGVISMGWVDRYCPSDPGCLCENTVWLDDGTTLFKEDVPYERHGTFSVTDDGRLHYGSVPDGSKDVPTLLFDLRNPVEVGVPPPVFTDVIHQPFSSGYPIGASLGSVIAAQASIYTRSSSGGALVDRVRPKTSYTYVAETVQPAQPGPASTYAAAGTFALTAFRNNWTDTLPTTLAPGGGWVRGPIVTHYDESGYPVEVRDVIDVPTTTEFTDNHRRVRSQVSGAAWRQAWSEDFETIDGSVDDVAHTGIRAGSVPLPEALITNLIAHPTDRPYVLSFWMYRNDPTAPYEDDDVEVSWGGASQLIQDEDIIASVEGWDLVDVVLPDGVAPGTLQFTTTRTDDIYVDDILIRPFESASSRRIVDATGEMRATLDDRGFAAVLQIDDHGRPVRAVVETLAGRLTTRESYAHLPGRMRPEEIPHGGAYDDIGTMVAPLLVPSSATLPSFGDQLPADMMRDGLVPDGTMPLPTGLGGTFDALDVKVSPSRRELKVFGRDLLQPVVPAATPASVDEGNTP